MTAWLVIIGIGLGSLLLRASVLVLAAKPLPRGVEARLALSAPAAVAAVLAMMTFTSHGRIQPLPGAELAAIGAGFVAVLRTGNVLHAFAVGLPVLWVATALG